ncbi:MAG: type II toxin-antitoxin system mRNA interferase toxin, RelE/StbE family [Candidatus Doudnabacteria bacterium]|nr:type II toxin-antitoxin system mRNA interferase toxin, RelE/StbE family [Candidatus Doudnabacteria bacterium]
MTSVFYHKHFQKKYSQMPKTIQMAFKERLILFLENPFNSILHNHDVHKAYPGCRSINVSGDYRAIFKQEENYVKFVNIDTHSELYG